MKEYKLCGELQLRTDVERSIRPRVAIQDGNVVDNLDVWIRVNNLAGKRVELTIKVLE